MTASRIVVLLVIIAGFTLALSSSPSSREAFFVVPENSPIVQDGFPVLETSFVSGNLSLEVHSATAVELNNGDIRVFWYGGKREGSKDTAIYTRVLHRADNSWSETRNIMNRQAVTRDTHRYIRKLGNAVAMVKGDELWLFFVSVSVGGWAGSSINLSESTDNGNSWGPVRRLISSPFINISTLVRNAPQLTRDGDVILPAYHEFLGKFSELLQLDSASNVVNKYRISHGMEAIQPTLLPMDATHAISLMRNSSARRPGNIWISHSQNGAADWLLLAALPLPNPDSAVTAVQLDTPEELLLAFNNHSEERDDITLAYRRSANAGWQQLYQFESGQADGKMYNPFSYPFLLQTHDDNFHLFYTWKKEHIKHAYFNRAALLKMMSAAGPES